MVDWEEEMDVRMGAKRNGGEGLKKGTVAFAYLKFVQEFSVSQEMQSSHWSAFFTEAVNHASQPNLRYGFGEWEYGLRCNIL